MMRHRIGIDFDNTIAGYDHVFAEAAVELGLGLAPAGAGKAGVRDALRRLPDGESRWMRLQGQVYGRFMERARLIDGVGDFLRRCRSQGMPVAIVSHKTQYGHFDEARVDLRDAARRWMTAQGFFDPDGFGLDPTQVFFEPTRASKIARIAALGCTVFIDDLPEVLDDPDFPVVTERHLYRPIGADGNDETVRRPYQVHHHWSRIADAVLS